MIGLPSLRALDTAHSMRIWLAPRQPTCGAACDMKLIQRLFNMDSS
jgi:hypothetical protein